MSPEQTQPDLTQTAGIVDPSLAAQPLNERSFDALKVQPDVQQTAVEGNEPGEFGMDSIPLASQELSDGRKLVMLYSVEANGQEYQVWTGQMEDGSNFKDAAMITHADFDVNAPKDDPRSWQVSLSSLLPSNLHLSTGKENEFVSFQLDKYGLQIGGKNGQEAVQVLSHAPVTETAETPVLHAEKLKVAEDAGEIAVEKAVAAPERPKLNLQDAINEGAELKQPGEQNPYDSARFSGSINGENRAEGKASAEFDPARFGAREEATAPAGEQASEASPEAAPADLTAIFASGESFMNALQDPQLDPATKADMNKLQSSWRELQLATATSEVWNEVLAPRLGELQDILPQLIQKNGRTVDAAQTIAQTLQRAASAVEYNDIEGVGDAFRYIGAPREDFEAAFLGNGQPREEENLGRVTNLLTAGEIDGDERIGKVANANIYGSITPEDAERLTTELRPLLEAGGSLETVAQSLQAKMPENSISWRQRQQAIQEVVSFARVSARGYGDSMDALRRAKQSFDMLGEEMQYRHRYDSAQMYEVAGLMQQVGASLEPVQHFMRIAAAEAANIR